MLLRWLGWFLLANVGLLCLISIQYFLNADLPQTVRGRVFLALAVPGHWALLGLLPYLPLAALATLYPRRRVVMASAVTLYALLALVIVIDARVYLLYRFHLNGMVLNLLSGGAVAQILPVEGQVFAIAGLVALALLLAELLMARLVWAGVARGRGRLGLPALGLMALIVLGGQFAYALADARQDTAVTRIVRFLPWPQMVRMDNALDRWGWVAKRARLAIEAPTGERRLRYPLEPLACRPPREPLNLLMILIDGWRFDMATREVAPHLWRLSQDSLVFERHFSSGNATRFGVFGLMYGLYSSYWNGFLGERRGPVLVDELLRQQYRFSIHGSARLTSPELDRTVFAAVRARIPLETPGEKAWGRDRQITDDFLAFLGQPGTGPFFGWLFYDSSHAFTFPPDYPRYFSPILNGINHMALDNQYDATPFLNRYKNAVHFVDSQVGRVLDELDARGLLERTVIVVTGDHGEEFNENRLNYWGHNGNFSRWQTQSPLIVHWPGKPPRTYSHLTSHLDVAPTLLRDLLDCTTPIDRYSSGRHLLDASQRPYLVIGNWDNLAIRQPDRITVFNELGHADVVDQDYREIPGAKPDAAILGEIIKEMGRFR
ncbi:MAG: DUF3413 domain-containing protein [Candidatus Lambdaproteobacteria bacterium]|nr:DUF3413 domain-containing protein [Candidatus Lambdaproteobacteria bacterium]